VSEVRTGAPSDSAADPRHPDHARWVLERLLRDGADWERQLGRLPDLHELQEHWGRTLSRLDQKRARKVVTDRAAAKQRIDPAEGRLVRGGDRHAQARARIEAERCRCPTQDCRTCRINRRVGQLVEFDTSQMRFHYPAHAAAILRIYLMASAGAGPFRGASPQEGRRIITRLVQDICDQSRSVPTLGEWDRPLQGAG
jgi:hypothetical protein